MNNSVYIIIIIILLILILFNNLNFSEKFDGLTSMGNMNKSPIFVDVYDNHGNKLNLSMIIKPFTAGSCEDFKTFLINKPNRIYLGMSSYMEFPGVPSNPDDKYVNVKDVENPNDKNNNLNIHYHDMYLDICDGWLHCFKNPGKFIDINKPHELISDSDFVNYNVAKPDVSIEKEYDYIYSCPKVNENSTCNDWVSYNKNWELAKKCIFKMSEHNIRGLLVGRKGCEIPKNCDATGWIDYHDMLKLYNKAKFIFVPNVVDASPRVLTEGMAINLPCLVNENILGGWKYVCKDTGEFFTNENDVVKNALKILNNFDSYKPREYIKKNYGPINAGKRLANFIFDNYSDKLILKRENVEYLTLRHPLTHFKP